MMISVLMMCRVTRHSYAAHLRDHRAAPCASVVGALVQGLSVGGEYEPAPLTSEVALRQRGFSLVLYVTLIGGQLLASLVVLIVQLSLSDTELRAWGAYPFFIGPSSR
jgi:hypothetical protein